MADDDFERFESFRQLPSEGDAVFRIGDQLVRFTVREEQGNVVGWVVTTGDPGYSGFLTNGQDTHWTDRGAESVREYSFEFRGDGTRPPAFMGAGPIDVSVEEFRRVFFADYSDET